MANKGQGFSEKCKVAEKMELKEADAGGPAAFLVMSGRQRQSCVRGLRRDGGQSHLEDAGTKRTQLQLPNHIRSQCGFLR